MLKNVVAASYSNQQLMYFINTLIFSKKCFHFHWKQLMPMPMLFPPSVNGKLSSVYGKLSSVYRKLPSVYRKLSIVYRKVSSVYRKLSSVYRKFTESQVFWKHPLEFCPWAFPTQLPSSLSTFVASSGHCLTTCKRCSAMVQHRVLFTTVRCSILHPTQRSIHSHPIHL